MIRTARLLAVATMGVVVLVGCGKSHTPTTASPSQLFREASQQLCGVESNVLGIVNDVSSGAVSSQSDAAKKLGDLQTQLGEAQHSFQKHGFKDLASKVGALSSGVQKLEAAVSGGNTAGIVTAAAAIANAIQALPGCSGVTPSG
jgi:X-X-X-Leu-X-X-Gly heptad repeat protein